MLILRLTELTRPNRFFFHSSRLISSLPFLQSTSDPAARHEIRVGIYTLRIPCSYFQWDGIVLRVYEELSSDAEGLGLSLLLSVLREIMGTYIGC